MENIDHLRVDVREFTKPALAEIYNLLAVHLGKPTTKRMESRDAGIRRVQALQALLPAMQSPSALPEPVNFPCVKGQAVDLKKGIRLTHAERAAVTWKDPSIKAARAKRYNVEVAGVRYRSVSAAFKALRLPLAKYAPFRMELIRLGEHSFDGHTFKVVS
jgi:hypothetical protein